MPKFLILTVLISLIIRLAGIAFFPPSLNWDEVSLGYNAYSLLGTGADEWGIIPPAIFRAFGDYKLPGFIYLSVVPIAVFGLTEFSVRLTSGLAGTLLVAVGYVLSRRLGLARNLSVTSAVLLAVSPWTWWLSRVAVEANLALLFITLGVTLLVSRRTFLGILFLGLSAWTYNSARLFAPLFLFFYLLLNRKSAKPSPLHWLLGVLLFLPIAVQLLSPGAQSRFRWLNLLDSGAIAQINELQSRPGGRLLYNKATYLAYRSGRNFLSHFSPAFLFISGGSHYQFSLPGHGQLYLVTLPLFYLGLIYLLKSQTVNHKSVLLWLLLAAIPGSLVRDAPHTLRAIFMSVPAVIVSVYGLRSVSRIIGRPQVTWILLIFISIHIFLYAWQFPQYARDYSWSWQYGHKQLVQYIKQNYDQYDEIIITKKYGEPHEFILFYWPWDPKALNADPHLVRYHRSDWYWVDSFAKFRFVNDWEMADYTASLDPDRKYLIAASPNSVPGGIDISRINFLDGSPAFLLFDRK